MKLTRQAMLERMLSADPASDGRFVTGVVSTGIYCLPSCRARKPLPRNVVFYDAPAQARAAGLRPCLRCKPDDFYAGVHADEAWLDPLLALPLAEVPNVAALAGHAGVSRRQLQELLWRQCQQTPAGWLAARRLEQARVLLLTTDVPITDIAFEVGFGSLSVFGTQFRRCTGMNAAAFRALTQGAGFTLGLPSGLSLPLLLAQLGRDPQQATQRVEGQRFSLALSLPETARVVQVDFTPTQATVLPTGPLSPADALALWQSLWRVLGLGSAPHPLEASDPLFQQAAGLRICLTPTSWDALLWAVLGQQVTFRAACTFRARLVRRLGLPLAGGLYPPPRPADLLGLKDGDWASIGLTHQRVVALRGLAVAVQTGSLDLSGSSVPRLERQLRAIPGLGPWSVAYVLLRGLGLPDIAPAGDNALAAALQRHFQLPTRPTPAEVTRLMAPYAPSRSLATLHFWQSLSGDP